MEFVDGANLRQMIAAKQIMPETALAIFPKVCEALQFAHDEGILHRDIKPENILIDKKGRVKIADFGLAKLIGDDTVDHSLTGTQQIMGTPRYMAPEQFENTKTVEHRADIYSLGVVFYEMLTGEIPMGRFALPSKKVQVDVRIADEDVAGMIGRTGDDGERTGRRRRFRGKVEDARDERGRGAGRVGQHTFKGRGKIRRHQCCSVQIKLHALDVRRAVGIGCLRARGNEDGADIHEATGRIGDRDGGRRCDDAGNTQQEPPSAMLFAQTWAARLRNQVASG